MASSLRDSNAPLLSGPQIGEMISLLSAAELKVMLYLALKVQRQRLADMPGFAPLTDGEFPLREIAAATNLSKKQVRHALRMLSISARYGSRFH